MSNNRNTRNSNNNNSNNSNNNNNGKKVVKFRRIKKKVCSLCAARIEEVDYKEVNQLKRYITDRGKIAPRRMTGLCPKHQRDVAKCIKKSRIVGLVPYVVE